MTDPRTPVFEAVRAIGRAGLFNDPGNILALHNLLDAFGAPRESVLGKLSERYESGSNGVGTVSSGAADPGGVSYGIWQLSSKAGTAAAFVAAEGERWRADFGGTTPGSAAFSQAWKRIAAREPQAFAAAQHAFIERTHYRPAVAAVRSATVLDLDSRHAAVRDATWSVAVQHGGAAKILTAAVKGTDAQMARTAAGYDKLLVETIYAERADYVLAVAAKSDPVSARALQGIVRSRYPAELADALAMFA